MHYERYESSVPSGSVLLAAQEPVIRTTVPLAVVEATRMLAARPGFGRILVLIGETRDRGSEARLQEAVSKAQAANVTIYPVSYSVYVTSFTSRGAETFTGTDCPVLDINGPMNLSTALWRTIRSVVSTGPSRLRFGFRTPTSALAPATGWSSDLPQALKTC